jgi:hypothetical protein
MYSLGEWNQGLISYDEMLQANEALDIQSEIDSISMDNKK